MSILEMRKNIKKQIDLVDNKTLKMINAILEIDKQDDWWNDLTNEQQIRIEESEQQILEGKGLLHEKAMKKIKNVIQRNLVS